SAPVTLLDTARPEPYRSTVPTDSHLERRGFLALLAACALGGPLVAEAQQGPGIARIAMLFATTQAAAAMNLEGFKRGLRELGYVEGKTFVLETRYGEARPEGLADLARELVGLKPNVIVVSTDPAVAAAKRQTSTIPIVMFAASDPVGAGF